MENHHHQRSAENVDEHGEENHCSNPLEPQRAEVIKPALNNALQRCLACEPDVHDQQDYSGVQELRDEYLDHSRSQLSRQVLMVLKRAQDFTFIAKTPSNFITFEQRLHDHVNRNDHDHDEKGQKVHKQVLLEPHLAELLLGCRPCGLHCEHLVHPGSQVRLAVALRQTLPRLR